MKKKRKKKKKFFGKEWGSNGDLEGCADRVIDLWMSGDWIAMAEQPRASEESLRDWFGWPEAAGSVVEEIARANWLSSDGGLL